MPCVAPAIRDVRRSTRIHQGRARCAGRSAETDESWPYLRSSFRVHRSELGHCSVEHRPIDSLKRIVPFPGAWKDRPRLIGVQADERVSAALHLGPRHDLAFLRARFRTPDGMPAPRARLAIRSIDDIPHVPYL